MCMRVCVCVRVIDIMHVSLWRIHKYAHVLGIYINLCACVVHMHIAQRKLCCRHPADASVHSCIFYKYVNIHNMCDREMVHAIMLQGD